MGEWDRALTVLEPLLSKNIRASFLNISIKAIETGDVSALAAITDNPDYIEIKPEIIFMLWRLTQGTSSERWRLRLIAEFPQTTEGRLAAGQSSAIIVRPNPFWLFAGGLDSLPLIEIVGNTTTANVTTNVNQTPSINQTPVAVSTAKIQTGIFGRQVNAQAQVTSLRQAGFSPAIEQRIVNNNEMWAVTVPAGTDQNRTINALRAAGFEAFLIR
jgi:hypothetical protein